MDENTKDKVKEKRILMTVEWFNTMLLVMILALLMSFISGQMVFNYVLYKQSETRMDYTIIGAIVGNPIAQEFLEIRRENTANKIHGTKK